VLRIDLDGTFTIANAGHFNPWLDGKEVLIDSGLPLGIAPDSTYVEATHLLPVDQQLTVVTDGVVEAMNSKGELYGFDRCALISTQSADDIAWTAQTFGQSDDITVLTVTRLERGDHSADLSPAQKHFGMGS
jgi:serine phosphatase RsbU (regulator of sigma subunit)